jgi:hypothetical protein
MVVRAVLRGWRRSQRPLIANSTDSRLVAQRHAQTIMRHGLPGSIDGDPARIGWHDQGMGGFR